MGQGNKYYFPQLDSVRGLSFLAVYFFHAVHPAFGAGLWSRLLQFLYNNMVLSIDVFFILSSFLLTWLGMREYKTKGNFSFINYFIRRALRIWPLYFLLMIFAFVLLPYVAAEYQVQVTLPPAYYYILFISNFYLEGHVYFLRFLWTLAVEEQFYLLWGVCLWFLQKYMKACILLLGLGSILYTAYAIANNIPHDFHTLTYLFDFAAGILAAYLLQENHALAAWVSRWGKKGSVLFLLFLPLLFVIMFFIQDNVPAVLVPWIDWIVRLLFILYTALFIMEQMANEKALLQLAGSSFLVYTGKISYGLYCFHGIVLTFGMVALEKAGLSVPVVMRVFLFLAINYLVAGLSYRVIESPFLKLKDKLRRI